jgi:tetratricopeptide (TPR) repeat protein
MYQVNLLYSSVNPFADRPKLVYYQRHRQTRRLALRQPRRTRPEEKGANAVKIKDMKFAIVIFVSALALLSCINVSEFQFGKAMSNGVREYTKGNYAEAERSFTDSLDWAERYGTSDRVVMVLGYLGRTYDEEGKKIEAESVFMRRLSLAESNNLDAATQIETYHALGIFLSKNKKCVETQQLLVNLEDISSELKSHPDYADTQDLIRDLIQLYCQTE